MYFVPALVMSLLIQSVFFFFASRYKTDKFTDLSYGFTFVLIIFSYFLFSQKTFPQMVLTIMVCIWGLRLAYFLFKRIMNTGKDKRFDGIREDFSRFLKFWIFQGIVIWIILLPALHILGSEITNTASFALGTFIWIIGFAIEAISDYQKSVFRSKNNKNSFISNGLWKYSRHPNYFGEILLWWGIFIIAFPTLKGFEFLTIIGPITITYLLLFVTGIPPLEKAADKKFKDDTLYQDYKKRTSILVPLPK